MRPVFTRKELAALSDAQRRGEAEVTLSLDLGRSTVTVALARDGWTHLGVSYPYWQDSKDNSVYYWDGEDFLVAARYDESLIKLVPSDWGAPTFQIDGVKMLPTARVSPYEDAGRKVALIKPRGKTVLDTCGGLGYFAAWCLKGEAKAVLSFEINPAVLWLRQFNPWSPEPEPALRLTLGDIAAEIAGLASGSVDAVLHDPPRFALAGELYSQEFYDHLARVIKRRGLLFHYTGTPNTLTTGRNVPNEVAKRLRLAGFRARVEGDGVVGERS